MTYKKFAGRKYNNNNNKKPTKISETILMIWTLMLLIYLWQWKWKSLSRVRLFATPWTDYTGHGILQARILEWAAFPFSRGSSQPRDPTHVSRIAGGFFTSWATREAQYICTKSLITQMMGFNRHWYPLNIWISDTH